MAVGSAANSDSFEVTTVSDQEIRMTREGFSAAVRARQEALQHSVGARWVAQRMLQ